PQPLVGPLDLVAVLDLLIEHAELVADAVAVAGDVERGHRIEEAGGEPAETAVAQPRVHLLLEEIGDVEADHPHRLASGLVEAEIEQVREQRPPHEELGGEVVDALRVAPVVALLRRDPALDEAVADGEREREEAVARRGRVLILCERVEQVVRERVQDCGGLVRSRGAEGPGRHGPALYRISVTETLSSSFSAPRRTPRAAISPLPGRWSPRPACGVRADPRPGRRPSVRRRAREPGR